MQDNGVDHEKMSGETNPGASSVVSQGSPRPAFTPQNAHINPNRLPGESTYTHPPKHSPN